MRKENMKKIDLNDLMIGNYVTDDENQLCRIESIGSKAFTDWNSGDDYQLKFATPRGVCEGDVFGIPLSPDVLKILGAYELPYGNDYTYKLPISAISILFRFNGIDCYSEIGGIYMGSQIEYVHQVQNVFRILSGRELVTDYVDMPL